MTEQAFPTDYYLDTLVRLLDTVKYQDNNYSREERLNNLHYAYLKAAKHFAQPEQQATLKVSPKRLQASLQTIVGMVVYSWTKVSPEVMADLSIHYTYTLVLDDSTNDPRPEMASFFEDFVHGRQQKHPWWRLVNDHFPNVLNHYGSFCALNLIRSTFDFFQGCWIEQYNFPGFPGSHDYPLFLRRLNGLGHCVGASLFPAAQFDEQALFVEITTAIAQMENWMVFVNDLMSFYKEFDDPRDQISLVINYCKVEGIGLNEALDKLTHDTIHCSEQMLAVFEGKDPKVVATLQAFVQGYITWHLCDPRYRLNEVYERSDDSPIGAKFRQYCEDARRVGQIDPGEWAVPSVIELVAQSDS
ncbi:Trichodiene synthase [Endocarpon pusillum]|uniref:Trichodiene synthase n=1 Tax=Endocarpon pusillum TaxID=364733 RepID=A0A8H7ABM5_9EURO|nr:Trichodiene synthase [Endocarpon pusillum]